MQSISVFLDKAKFADFRLKNADVSSQQNSRGVSRDSYIFWIFFRWGITVPSFIIAGVTDFRQGGGLFAPLPPIREQPWKGTTLIGLSNHLEMLRKRCPENMQQIYRRKHMPKCDLNKIAKELLLLRVYLDVEI